MESMMERHPLAAALDELSEQGIRKVMVTGLAAGGGKSLVTAEAGLGLARAGRKSVALVDADALHPRLHGPFGLPPRRGVVELLEEIYLCDIAGEATQHFGVGDWLEILRAQGRSGELTVNEEGAAYAIRIVKGAPCSISCIEHPNGSRLCDVLVKRGRITPGQKEDALLVQGETGRPVGEVLRTLGSVGQGDVTAALQLQLSHRLAKIIGMKQPRCCFAERPEPYLPAAGERVAEKPEHDVIRRLLHERVQLYLRHPYLSSQVPSYLADTDLPGLKLLTAGTRPRDLQSPDLLAPFGLLLDRLGSVFDLVVVDAPPVSRAVPAYTLARIVDGVLLVVEEQGADVPQVRRTVDELRRSGGNVLGVVLARARERRGDWLAPDDGTVFLIEELGR
jgi:Mrp family chromosome partitioning ATPase